MSCKSPCLFVFRVVRPPLSSSKTTVAPSFRNSDAMKGIFISTSNFSAQCEKFASENNISLINGDLLVDYFNEHGINSHILHK